MRKTECTTILVGKKASIDGTIIIARNEDYHDAINLKKFVVHEEKPNGSVYESDNTKVKVELPKGAMRYTAIPSDDKNEPGAYAEAGFNELGVAVSSTESLYGNERVLALDPLVLDGIAEDAINDLVTPYAKSARDGIKFLGELIKKYGSAEGNGILFADKDEAWYMEIPTGHHWVAVRIPDDCYAVAPNHVCIEQIDFNDKENYMWSEGMEEFVKENNLNPDFEGFNFRKVFGTYRELDRVYNTPRAWYAHKLLSSCDCDPTCGDIPFIKKATRKISVEDCAKVLGSHYNETEFDPLGWQGTEQEKKRFRCISLSRTAHSHILQVYPDLDEKLRGVTWLSFGTTAFNPYVPFFNYVEDTPKEYRTVPEKMDINNAYWLAKVFAYYAEEHYKLFNRDTHEFLQRMAVYGRQRVMEIQNGAKGLDDKKLMKYLTEENQKTATYFIEETKKQLQDYATRALFTSKLTFQMDKNL